MTKEGAKDKYAVGFVTHTVSLTFDDKERMYAAWRLGTEPGNAVQLGAFRGENGFEMAKLCIENDARDLRKAVA